ncbi:SHOCT domain-containing protein [Rhodococcus sp. NPDC003322]
MSLFRTAARTAVASSVHGRVQRRQQSRWAAEDQAVAAPATTPPAPAVAPAPRVAGPTPSAPVDTDAMLAQLERLAALRTSGVLTDDEFAAQKARILAG